VEKNSVEERIDLCPPDLAEAERFETTLVLAARRISAVCNDDRVNAIFLAERMLAMPRYEKTDTSRVMRTAMSYMVGVRGGVKPRLLDAILDSRLTPRDDPLAILPRSHVRLKEYLGYLKGVLVL